MIPDHWRVTGIVTLWHVAASVCFYAIHVATPFFRDGFGMSRFSVGILLASLSLGYAIFLLPIGALVDAYGERGTLVAGLAGLSLGAFAVTLAPSSLVLMGVVFAVGAFYGTATPGTNRAIFSSVPVERQNLAISVKQVSSVAGSAVSALVVTGLATTRFGWRGGFLVATGIGVLVTGFFVAIYRAEPPESGGRTKLPDVRGLLGNRPFRWLVLAGFCLGTIMYTVPGYTLLYIEEGVGLTVGFAGLAFAAMQVAGGAGRVATGWVGDALPGRPRRRTAGLLFALVVAGTVLLWAVPSFDSRATAFAGFVLLGFFVLGSAGIYFSCIGLLVPTDESGSASAGGQLAFTLGGLVAPPLFGYLADTAGYGASWLFLAAMSGLAAVFLARLFYGERIAAP